VTGAATDPVDLLLGSLRIYSPTKQEWPLARYLRGSMKELGYSHVRTDAAGNIIGEIRGTGPRLLLCGHMDTVPGPLPVRRIKGGILGRGAADAKSPLCALLLAGAASAGAGVRVTFAGVTEEEGEGAGVNQILKRAPKYDYAVFGEPGGASRVTVGYRGRVSVHVAVNTQGGHAGSPWAHRSAFDEFNSFLAKLKEYEKSKEIPDDHFRSLSVSPTLVRAGTFHNVVPSLCEATLDLRVPPGMKVSTAVKEIRALATAEGEGVKFTVQADEGTEPYQADPGSSLVRAFQRAILLRLETKPGLIHKTGTGDMNTFARRTRAQCVTYGPGLTKTSHTAKETVEVEDYLDSIEVLKEAIRQLGVMARGSGK
jgi:[amino group carrier protein]-lysine/ornithine hydrolase